MKVYNEVDLPNIWQNWSITQDDRGLLYVANNAGVLEFDGTAWRLIEIAGSNAAFSVDVDTTGRIYVGSRAEFGYLTPDATGNMQYTSLMAHVNPADKGFIEVWNTAVTPEGVYYQASNRLFRWDGETMNSWSSSHRLHTSFEVNDRFYVKQDSVGLLTVVEDSLALVPGGERFANKRIFFMGAHEEQVFIAAQEGLFGPLELCLYDGERFIEIPPDPHFVSLDASYTYYNGGALSSGNYALATLYNGVFLIDEEGNLLETLDAERGISGDINYTFSDAQGGLWLAHDVSGISYLPAPLGLSEYGKGEGLSASVNKVLRYKGRLYVATDVGMYRLNNRVGGDPVGDLESQFDPILWDEGVEAKGKFWSMLIYEDDLIVGSEYGIFRLDGNLLEPIEFDSPEMSHVLVASSVHPGRIYTALKSGLGILTRTGRGWETERIHGSSKKIHSIVEDEAGALWLGTATPSTIWKLDLDETGQIIEETLVTDSKSLDVPYVYVDNFGGEVGIQAAPRGIFRPVMREGGTGIDVVLDERYPHGSDSLSGPERFVDLAAVNPSTYWSLYGNRIEATTIIDGVHVRTVLPEELMLPDWGGFRNLYIEENGVVWVSDATHLPLMKYDPGRTTNAYVHTTFTPVVRRLTILGGDSLLYGGAFATATAPAKFEAGRALDLNLDHEDNDLLFEYALPHFNRQGQVEYQYRLEGQDKTWSRWTPESSVTYRNIDYGDVEFSVRARVAGIPVDGVASVSLTIHPPWFWSWWMKIFYTIFFGFSVFQFVRYQRAKKQIVLLNIERELNARLQLANSQLRTANDSLEQANRMKDEFLANASHELRTPLTAILGFTSVLKEEVPEDNLEFLSLIDENGKRLLQTINSLLDLAKLRAGMLELNFELLDIGEKSEEVVDLLAQLALNQGLTLEIERPAENLEVRLDGHCYERILYNLIGNAIKFTRDGHVRVKIERIEDEVFVHIIDTGIGIDAQFLPMLFDEFKQEPNTDIRSEGSGLGLTITAKLVELLDGQISVKSEKGKGSTFTVSFKIDEFKRQGDGGSNGTHTRRSTQKAIQ